MALDEIMPVLYADLRRLARSFLGRERKGHTLQPTALVHEAYLRLSGQNSVDWQNRAQVLALAARMMRRVLLDHASSRGRAKRGGGERLLVGGEAAGTFPAPVDFIDLDRALTQLQQRDPQQAAVVELRFFGGLTIDETAGALNLSAATVEREWSTARLWLSRQMRERKDGGRPLDPG
jgi:RNA polymerase sigma-70 factor, ECF subfamily